jgi:hypothetical protein
MTNSELPLYAGWSALVSAIATILGLVTLILFFFRGQPWGTLNDIISVILALSMLPVLLVLYSLHQLDAPGVSLATLVVGTLAMLVIFKVITFAQTSIVVPAAFGLLGIALMVFSYRAYASGTLPQGLVVLGIVAGAGYVLTIAGFLLGGEQHPLTGLGGLTAVISYPIWAVWFSRLLLSGRVLA